MKILIYAILFPVLFFSCVTTKQFDSKAKEARETSYQAALIKEDGTVITGQSLKHKNHDPYDANIVRQTNKEGAFTLDSKKYADNDIVAFQDSKAYYKRYNGNYLIRLVKGKINLYYFDETRYQMSATKNVVTSYFFDKDNGPVSDINITRLKDAVKDKPEVLRKLNSYYPKDSYIKELSVEKLAAVVREYDK